MLASELEERTAENKPIGWSPNYCKWSILVTLSGFPGLPLLVTVLCFIVPGFEEALLRFEQQTGFWTIFAIPIIFGAGAFLHAQSHEKNPKQHWALVALAYAVVLGVASSAFGTVGVLRYVEDPDDPGYEVEKYYEPTANRRMRVGVGVAGSFYLAALGLAAGHAVYVKHRGFWF